MALSPLTQPRLIEPALPERAPSTNEAHVFVTIVMPALNEERYIATAIDSLTQVIPSNPAPFEYELLVMDGGSTDATEQIVAQLAAENPRIRFVHNPKRLQSAALNQAALAADPRANILIRADCHARYPSGFVAQLIETMAETSAQSVVVSMRAVGKSCAQKAIAAAQNSRLGNGGSAHRLAGQKGFVDHGHHAAFDRGVFIANGGYDEGCAFNEDAEFDRRLANDGGKIFLNGDIVIDYFPRDTFKRLARQYANHGWGRANTMLRHQQRLRVRQVLPVAVLAAALVAAVLALLVHPVFWLVPMGYLAAALIGGAAVGLQQGQLCAMASGLAAITMHMSWATGFLRRCFSALATSPSIGRSTAKLRPLQ